MYRLVRVYRCQNGTSLEITCHGSNVCAKHIYSHWAGVVMSGCWDYDLTRNISWTAMYSITPGRRQSKTSILSTNVDQKSLETEFSIVICRPTGAIWQSKTPFLSIFDPRLSIVQSVFDCRLPGVSMLHQSHIESDNNTNSDIYLLPDAPFCIRSFIWSENNLE